MTKQNPSLDDVSEQADAATAVAADTLRPLVDHLLAGVHDAVEHLADVASKAVDKVELSGEYLKTTQANAVRGARGYVRERPLTSVGVALAAGYLLSWALRQR